jgi:hypothetical protein
MFATELEHVTSRPYIAPFHMRYKNLELKNVFSVVSHGRTENTLNSILLFVETNLTLPKANNNLIININRWDHSNVRFFNWQTICPLWWIGVATNDWYSNGYELCFTFRRFVSTYMLMRQLSCNGFSGIKIEY